MIYILIIGLGLIVDRLTKVYAVKNFIDNPITSPLINFTYLENRGAAFGILQDKRIFFLLITLAIVGYLIYQLYKTHHKNPPMINISLAMIISGALGNFYDRLVNGYVVDFIEFSFINFPIFNVADILVTLGCGLMIIYILFFDQKERN